MIKSLVGRIYNWIVLLSPRIEVKLRALYWNNVSKFKSLNPNKPSKPVIDKYIDFERIEDWLREQGVKKGDLLIVHSSYAELECTGLSPEEVVDRLLALVGPSGTLCMPVIRKFKGEPKNEDCLTADLSGKVFTYDVKWTKIISGLLPFYLMKKDNAVVSKHPFNPMCALGPLAKEMVEHNIDGDYPSPHGKNSSWKFCYDHNAKICFIGTDLEHHNTMTHVAEEAFGDWYWPDKEWYDIVKFNIIDENEITIYKEVYNRKAKWGMLHYAENNVNRDLKKDRIVKTALIDGYIEVGFEEAKEFVDYLRSKNKKGYPYF